MYAQRLFLSKLPIFRKIVAFAAVLCIYSSCVIVESEIGYMRQSLADIRERLAAYNEEISALQSFVAELQASGYAIYTAPVYRDGEEFLSITFKSGRTVVVGSPKQGKDGTTDMCLISVKEEDGVWYWTIAGEWLLLPDGSRAIAVGRDGRVGRTPLMRIMDGWWEVSLDDGETWKRIMESTGRDGYTVFTEVDNTQERYIFLTLSDGQVIQVPRFLPVEIKMDVPADKCLIAGGETKSVPYDLTGNVPDDLFLVAGGDGKYTVQLKKETKDKGQLIVSAPKEYSDGYVFLMADDSDGNSFLKVIEFRERSIDWLGYKEYSAPASGGGLEIPFLSNFECVITVQEGYSDWISNVGNPYSSEKFSLYCSANREDKVRVGLVNVSPSDNPEFVFATLTIVQGGRGSMIDRPSLEVDSDGGEFRIQLFSADGISMSALSDEEELWLDRELTSSGGEEWFLDITVHKNRSYEGRSAEFSLFNASGSTRIGTITIYQRAWSADRENDMILTGRANVADDYTVYLPLRGEVDCLVDWGDGSSDRVARNLNGDDWLCHRYDDSAPQSYTITVSGSVEQLNSMDIPSAVGIISIEQWGRLGLKSMQYAFYNNTRLTYLPPDLNGSFKTVTSFRYAFGGCKRLKDVSRGLFAYCQEVNSFEQVFSDCKSLSRLPEGLFSGCGKATSLFGAFRGCTSLTYVPETMLAGCESITNCSSLFQGCSVLKKVPENLFAECPAITNMEFTFSDCGLAFVPGNLFSSNHKVTTFQRCFQSCPIEDILGSLFAENKEVTSFAYCFYNCRIKNIPANLFDNNRKVKNFTGTFWSYWNNNYSDGSIIMNESPYTIIKGKKVHLYERADNPDYFTTPLSFGRCFSNRNQYLDDIPDEWL